VERVGLGRRLKILGFVVPVALLLIFPVVVRWVIRRQPPVDEPSLWMPTRRRSRRR
jgi:hypothetical protein